MSEEPAEYIEYKTYLMCDVVGMSTAERNRKLSPFGTEGYEMLNCVSLGDGRVLYNFGRRMQNVDAVSGRNSGMALR